MAHVKEARATASTSCNRFNMLSQKGIHVVQKGTCGQFHAHMKEAVF